MIMLNMNMPSPDGRPTLPTYAPPPSIRVTAIIQVMTYDEKLGDHFTVIDRRLVGTAQNEADAAAYCTRCNGYNLRDEQGYTLYYYYQMASEVA